MTRFAYSALAVAVAGCAHPSTAVVRAPDHAGTIAVRESAPAASAASVGGRCSSDLECPERNLCIRGACVEITPDLAECSHVRVAFEFNSALVAPAARVGLERSARCLRADHALHVTIEGNTDERGTEEYNLALGDQRATGVAELLRALGVSDPQLRTVSFGKERPLCIEHDEACWARNRRAELNLAEAGKRRPEKK